MADVNANIGINIDTSQSLAEIKNLQRQLALLYTSINKGSAAAAAAQKGLATNLMNTVNAGGKFYAQMGSIRTSTESFTHALEKNKLTMREYFRFAGGATKTFGKLFKSEYDTIGKVAEERVKKMQTQYIKLGRDASGAMKAISITPTSLNMKEYGNQVSVAAQKQALLNQLLKQGSTNLLNFGKNTQWAGRQLMVGFTVPLTYFGTAAAKTFMDLEAQAIKFKRVYGDMFTTTSETDKALQDIQAIANEFTKYGVAVVDTMEMAAGAAAMGKKGAELTAQVAQATRLAVLGGVEQQQALDTTISLTNAFGIAAEELTSKVNFLNAVENQTVTSIEDLTIAIPKAGPVIQQLGGSVEDLAFFLTAMREGGINASEGANALKSGLASLINPTNKASQMLADLGINIKDIVERNKGDLKRTVIEFAQALDTLAPLERSRAIEQLFGKFQFARLSTLFQNITKDGTQASNVLKLAGASVEELAILSERELKTVEDAVGTKFRATLEQLKVAIAPIGKEFLKAITPVAEFLVKLLDGFNNLGDGTKKFIVVITTLVGLIGPTLLMTFGLVANGAANIIKMFLLMRQGFLKLSGNTTNLAQQTQYMTMEQMEAATVAASLNQAHTRLTQQFGLEATAVRQLRNAYVEATAAALRFAAANPGMMLPGFKKKFATGTTAVPGSGSGDTVPSLLTPGEAVIPAPIAQDDRFKPIIAALVSGAIKKYKKGTVAAGDDYAHVGGGQLTDLDKIIQTGGLTQNERRQAEIYRDILKASGQKGEARSYGSLAYSFDAAMNKQMATVGVPIDAFEKAWADRPDKWISSGLTQSEARVVDSALIKQIKMSGASRITDNVVENAFKNLPAEIKATPAYQKMSALHGKIGSYSLGRGLGSTPQTSAQILEQAKKSGIIKDYRVETRVGTNGQVKTKSLIVVTKDNQEVNLGRGSRANRVYFADGSLTKSQKAAKQSIAVAKGEVYQTRDGKTRVVTGQTGKPKPAGKNVTRSPQDTRVLATQNLKRVFPYGVKGPRYAGAVDGAEFGEESGKPATRAQRLAGSTGTMSMAAGTAAMVAAMSGAPQIITNMLGGLSAVTALLPLLSNPLGIAVAGMAALGIAIYKFNSDIKKAREEGAAFAKSMVMTNQKLIELSKITGTVSASELAKRQRQSVLSGASGVQRKTGQNILESQFGQGLIKDIEKQQKAGSTNTQVAKNMGVALSTAIMQGVLTTEQAKSLAAALGEKLGSYEIPAKISGTISSLVGPNGEKLENEPLQVALSIKQESIKEQATAFQNAINSRKPLRTTQSDSLMAGGTAALALAGTQLATTGWTGVGAVAAAGEAVVGLTMMGKALWDQNKAKAANLTLDTAAIQLGFEAVAQGQGLVDSLNRQYDSKIKQAKTTEEIARLEAERKKAIDTVNAENKKTLDLLIQQKDQFSPGAFDAAIKAAADTMYKEGPMAVFKDEAIKSLSALKNSKFKTTLQLGLASGDLDPNQIISIINVASGNETLQANFDFIVKTQGLADANVLLGLLQKSGANEQTYTIITDFVKKNPAQFKEVSDALNQISNILPKYGVTVDINTVGLEQVQQVQRMTNALKNQKKPLTQTVIADLRDSANNPVDKQIFQDILNNWNTLVGSSKTITKEMVIDFTATYGDKNVKDFLTTSMGGGAGVPQHVQDMINSFSTTGQASAYLVGTGKGAANPQGPKPLKTPVNTGTRDTTLDDLLNKLKFVRKASIDAVGGINELMNITKGKGLTQFAGITQQLMQGPKGGFNREFISFLESMDDKTRKTYMTIKDGQPVLTKQGEALKTAFNEKVVGEYQLAQVQAKQDTLAQGAALEKLKAAGVDSSTALEMVADANLAVAINSKDVSSEELKKMADDAKAAQTAINALNLEFKNLADNLKKEMKTTATGLSAMLQAQAAGYTQESILSYIEQNPAFAKEIMQKGINSKDIQDVLKDLINKDTFAELGNAIKNPVDYAMGKFNELKNKAFESLDAIDRKAEEDFQSFLDTTKVTFNGVERNISDTIEAVKKQIEDYQNEIDLLNRRLEKEINRPIEDIQKYIDTLQRSIEINYDRPIQALQDESNLLSNDITLMDKAAEGINAKYDEQEKALQRISDINKEILNQDQGRLSVADALTRGDMAAAAQAAEQMRASAAQAAAERFQGALAAGRAAEIGNLRSASGLTRQQIEDRQFQIGQKIFGLEQDRKDIQAKIVIEQDKIYNLEKAREPIVKAIRDYEDKIYELNGDYTKLLPSLNSQVEAQRIKVENTKTNSEKIRDAWIKSEETLRLTLNPQAASLATSAAAASTAMQNALNAYNNIQTKTVDIIIRYTEQNAPGSKTGDISALQKEYDDLAEKLHMAKKSNLAARAQELEAELKRKFPNGRPKGYMYGGLVRKMGFGGSVAGKGMTDSIPAMLTPGEFIVNRNAAKIFGPMLERINNSKYPGMIDPGSVVQPGYKVTSMDPIQIPTPTNITNIDNHSSAVYNYNVDISVNGSSASTDGIAREVINQIRYLDAQRIQRQKA